MTRVGFGVDVHAFDDGPPVLLLGVAVDHDRGLAGHSDGDAAAHAVIDALLGATGKGDIGMRFPSEDPAWDGADSMALLTDVAGELTRAGWTFIHVDVTVVAQTVRIAPARQAMLANLAKAVSPASVSVKATTTDHLGALGRNEGVAVYAVATVSYDA